MNTIKKILAISMIALGMTLPISGFAQSLTDGEVKKVDLETGKVTIKHGEIKHLDMPSMTMVFTAKNKNLLTDIKAGEKIKFMVVNEGGRMIVTDIQPAQ
ncbi:MAG: copper-binding protein [Burkholderiales bacterium 35-55-47]|jgi:Cu/Ag efflux protein CusF|uniref:copper-binding protein n=1 Tax=Limnohabitans sp. TaxID=1907725 RepID=UPI000BD4849A|nr:copper-binding protein [Limnohabitans sp.]OYY18848.1 MAG: copper-binding protein [Burkholderiales bacterium 35-55-47]OYZ73667.1 MAG: copper-binding protein [Burkholderiales bacterium 24-55-52]OZB00812.1 MAG: copper-binding protein [Burkholderiales bacterium 39-55-53]HQR85423.1 copper-binding protein [Limnohabitans sp.]HQS26660.1 copper-binding protein [Limnohabitans sp.]